MVLPDVTCTPVIPIAPTVVQATCANGVVTEPTITLATDPTGVTYSADPAGPYDGTADTTATRTSATPGFPEESTVSTLNASVPTRPSAVGS